jgi:hypothetical protein
MKKIVLLFALAAMAGNVVEAKDKKNKKKSTEPTAQSSTPLQMSSTTDLSTSAPEKTAPSTTLKASDMAFADVNHDFGTVQEGPDAVTKFTFVNKGTEAIVIQKAQASCGCTVPTYSKEPIAPGAEGAIDVAFHTMGKPAGGFQKTVTVTTNAGVQILTIKGSVEKAPTTSVPENNSMIKTN